MADRTIRVDWMTRVEGEGALRIGVRDGEVRSVELRLFEPPRFFEAFLRGRSFLEVPDVTSRICGICPVAYEMSSCHAMEDALGVVVSPEIHELRRILYFAEWIESHALHVFLLHAPDFFGVPDAIAMAAEHGELVRAGLRIRKAGNALLRAIGGREIHPVNVRVGGFYRAPTKRDLEALLPGLEAALDDARAALDEMAGLDFPELERDRELVALVDPSGYAILGRSIASNRGLVLDVRSFDEVFAEEQVPWSTALQSAVRGRGSYLTGPLARFELGFERLAPVALECARAAGIEPPCRNPFRSILVRLVETIHALDGAIRGIAAYVPPDPPFVEVTPRAGRGFGASEAPRGLLYHRYEIDDEGIIVDAKIVPPTSQNQAAIEADLREMAPRLISAPRGEAAALAESVVRSHDPCISCATHFLDLRIEEETA